MKRKVVGVILAGALALGMCGCDMLKKATEPRFSEEKAVEIFEDELDAEEEDTDDCIEAVEDIDYDFFEDGLWFSCSKKESKTLYRGLEISDFIAGLNNVESSTNYLLVEGSGSHRQITFVSVMTFDDKEDIDDLFEDSLDKWEEFGEEQCDDYEIDDDDEEMLGYFTAYDEELYTGLYRDGNNAVLIFNYNNDRTIDDVCEAFDVSSPTDLA